MFEGTLSGRRALVTGASRGIGRAVALALARAGADLALVGRDAALLARVAEQARALDRRAVAICADVTSDDAPARLAAEAAALGGPVDLLINNAGTAESAPFLRTDRALLERMLAIHVRAVFEITRAFLPGMIEQGFGRVIQIASTAGRTGARYTTAYTAAKHAQVGFTRALALEVADKGVTVNSVCPGYVDTDLTRQTIRRIAEKTALDETAARRALEKESPQGRLIDPDEVAALVVFLCTDAAAGIHGQAIPVCGGSVLA